METKKFGAAAIILNDEGHVLLVKQSYGAFNWELPGGAAEPGESPAEAVIREVREETGLDVVVEKMTGWYFESHIDFHHYAFVCTRVNPEAGFEPDAEVTECAFHSIETLPRPMSDFTLRRIRDALAGEIPSEFIEIGPRRWLD